MHLHQLLIPQSLPALMVALSRLVTFLVTIWLLHHPNLNAQPSLVATEHAFAAYALDHNVKDAFLEFLDSSAVLLFEGRTYNAVAHWSSVSDTLSTLSWEPQYFGIAASGDLGFTTGPFVHKDITGDTIEATGNYISLWRQNAEREWKLILDLGVSVPGQSSNRREPENPWTGLLPSPLLQDNILKIEQEFIARQTATAVDKADFSRDALCLYNNNNQPKENIPAGAVYLPLKGGTAISSDLAYVYGKLSYRKQHGNYLRIWGNTATGWIILLEARKW